MFIRLISVAWVIVFLFAHPVYAQKVSEYLKYDGESAMLDIYNPGISKAPVVILLHGASGITGTRAARYARFASDLMNKNIIAINVHYFNSKEKNWVNTVIETINYAQRIPNADKERIGLIGYSLGGTLALQVASVDTRIKLLAINSGFLPAGFSKENASGLPKTFMVSGSKDNAIQTLNALRQWFLELGKAFEYKINEGLGHNNVPMNIFNENWQAILNFFVNNF